MKVNFKSIIALGAILAGFSCTENMDEAMMAPGNSTVSLHLSHTFGEDDFVLDQTYTSSKGQAIQFDELRYWISNVELHTMEGEVVSIPDSYYLIQHMKEQLVQDKFVLPDSVREHVILKNVPTGTYSKINFSIGIDPVYNNDLTLIAGELNALQNMASASWMWFTSYIFTKVHGTVGTGEEAMAFSFETGSNDCYKTVSLKFPEPILLSDTEDNFINISNDVEKLLGGIAFDETILSGTTYTIGASKPEQMMKLSGNFEQSLQVK